jgi:hypothetical protein
MASVYSWLTRKFEYQAWFQPEPRPTMPALYLPRVISQHPPMHRHRQT